MHKAVEYLLPHLLETEQLALLRFVDERPYIMFDYMTDDDYEHGPAFILQCLFIWSSSPQGHGYWSAVRDRLNA
mgnify:FL=1